MFISLPPSMKKTLGSFKLRPDIVLPIEPRAQQDFDSLDSLSWEMIIAGMLKILAYSPEHEHADYYRHFVLAVEPDIIEKLTTVSILKAQNQDWDMAEELFLTLVGLDPENPRAVLNLALMYEQRSERTLDRGEEQYKDSAFRYYLRALQAKPELPETYFYAGYFFLRQQSFGRARKEFNRFMDLSNDEEKKQEIRKILEQIVGSSERETLFSEAFDFIRLGQEQEGLNKINSLIKLQPELWNAWFLKGWALRRLAQFNEAYEAFVTARSLGGNSSDLLNETAICAMEIGRLEEGYACLIEALKQSPIDNKIISNLGICSIKMGKWGDAEQYFRQILHLDSADKIAQHYLDLIEKRQ